MVVVVVATEVEEVGEAVVGVEGATTAGLVPACGAGAADGAARLPATGTGTGRAEAPAFGDVDPDPAMAAAVMTPASASPAPTATTVVRTG